MHSLIHQRNILVDGDFHVMDVDKIIRRIYHFIGKVKKIFPKWNLYHVLHDNLREYGFLGVFLNSYFIVFVEFWG